MWPKFALYENSKVATDFYDFESPISPFHLCFSSRDPAISAGAGETKKVHFSARDDNLGVREAMGEIRHSMQFFDLEWPQPRDFPVSSPPFLLRIFQAMSNAPCSISFNPNFYLPFLFSPNFYPKNFILDEKIHKFSFRNFSKIIYFKKFLSPSFCKILLSKPI